MKVVAAVVFIVAGVWGAAYGNEMVDDKMVLPAKNGNVLFPHDRHILLVQKDCKTCHERPGAIEGFGKKYAHDKCIGCHQPKDDYPGGPVKCDECHGTVRG